MDKSKIEIAFLTTYPPRECGIATFAKALVRTFDNLYVENASKVIAVSDEIGNYPYSDKVVFEIDQFDKQSYVRAADHVNRSSIEVISLQHEYGIFGGKDGDYILAFLENVNKPVVTSFHSVLREHREHRYKLTQRIIDLSESVVVMTQNAKKILLDTFDVNPNKIKIVPHGVPNVRFDEKSNVKKGLGLNSKVILSTFGLINRGKGIEVGIEAVAKLAKSHPDLMYLIIGATHPGILKKEGESYRESLEELVRKNHIEDNVRFINRYLDYKDLVDYLKATDIYLAPQLDLAQAFSGTLSYALGCGSAVVSSPTNYAQEILSSGRGVMVYPEVDELVEELNKLLAASSNYEKIGLRGYRYARSMIWPQVGLEYLKVLEENLFITRKKWARRLPDFSETPSLKFIEALTDDSGIREYESADQSSESIKHRPEDQTEALVVCAKLLNRQPNDKLNSLVSIYLTSLEKLLAIYGLLDEIEKGDARWNRFSEIASRSFRALAYVTGAKNVSESNQDVAGKLLSRLNNPPDYDSIRPVAYDLLGHYQSGNKESVKKMADILVDKHQTFSSKYGKWQWFESELTYTNAIIPLALVKAYKLTGDSRYLDVVKKTLIFLETVNSYKGIPSPVGQEGWYHRGKQKSLFDQQSIEAAHMIVLYNELARLTKSSKYAKKAREWMGWYFGNNVSEVVVYNSVTRGVYDAVTRRGVNLHQGAESTLAYLSAYLSFEDEF